MSKITNDGLTRSGTGRFIAVRVGYPWQQWALKGKVNSFLVYIVSPFVG